MIARMPRAVTALAALVALVLSTASAQAQIHRWIDDAGTAHYADSLQNVPETFKGRAIPLNLRNSPVSSTDSNKSAAREAAIRFTPGRHIVVEARVNGSTSAKLYLDTGAAHTLLSPRILRLAGVSPDHDGVKLQTRGMIADTKTEVYRVAIDSLEVGDARVGKMLVSAYDMDMPDVDGLLGQDFLALFKVTIDASRGIVTIAPK